MLGKVVVMEVIQLTQMRVLQLVVVITSSGGGNHAQVDGLVQLSLSRLLLLATNDQRQEAAVDCLHSAGSAGRHRAGVRQHHIGAGYRLPGGELDQHRGGAHLHSLLLTTVCGSGSRGDQSQWKRSGPAADKLRRLVVVLICATVQLLKLKLLRLLLTGRRLVGEDDLTDAGDDAVDAVALVGRRVRTAAGLAHCFQNGRCGGRGHRNLHR
ncbi:hypothetical protein TYRP_021356 [Tyrophagus putrescentiae]|nr:hypothetical protein TYRP_021356 [Tyrophagus putrescentiae]